jgi:hypothetical protein
MQTVSAGACLARLAAVGLAGAVLAAAAGCGQQHAGAPAASGSPAAAGSPSPAASVTPGGPVRCPATASAQPGTSVRTLTLTGKDNGKVFCVPAGARIAIYLRGTPAHPWGAIRSASPVLKPVPDGRLMLEAGVTGAFFQAVRPGTATVRSIMTPCQRGSPGASVPPSGGPGSGPQCQVVVGFHITLLVTGSR